MFPVTGPERGSITLQAKNFREDKLNSKKPPGFLERISNSSTFRGIGDTHIFVTGGITNSIRNLKGSET